MRCPFCKYPESQVRDTRPIQDGTEIRRRRSCVLCNRRFTTYEVIQETLLMVAKKDGRRESFSKDKMQEGLRRACQKRPISSEQIEDIVEEIERECRINFEKEVSAEFIGEQVIQRLRKLDPVAYVRFASVYREFEDVNTFMQEIRKLKKSHKVFLNKRKSNK